MHMCSALGQDQQRAPGVDSVCLSGAGQAAQPFVQSNSEAPCSQVPVYHMCSLGRQTSRMFKWTVLEHKESKHNSRFVHRMVRLTVLQLQVPQA